MTDKESNFYEGDKINKLTAEEQLMEDEINAELNTKSGAVPHFSKTSGENISNSFKDDRVIRRAKRCGGKDGNKVSGTGNGKSSTTSGSHQQATQSHRSRNRQGKKVGEPKKGGAGGKGVWGKYGAELDETGDCRDIHDPNYDSDVQGDYKLVTIEPLLNDDEVEQAIRPILLEYLENANSHEVEEQLGEINIGSKAYLVVKSAILLGMDRHNAQRELISQLISDLYTHYLSEQDVAKGFDHLLQSIDDIRLDTPDAHNLLGQFIARCIADDCLPPKFIASYKGTVDNQYVKEALEKANVLITMKQGMAHLDNIWGLGGGNRPVKYLTNKMVILLKEYLSSEDLQEACTCLAELEVPHFHHELVYQACDISLEASTEAVMDSMVRLFKHMVVTTLLLSVDQFERGIKRIYDDICDISLDVPNASQLLETICAKFNKEKVLSDTLLNEYTARGRKRFVSEGDGGLLKPVTI